MSFENTKNSLSYLEEKEDITVFDIFNLFHNVCDDAESMTHSKLEKIPCKNVPEEDLISSILWCGKKMVRIITKNKEQIADPYYIEALEREADGWERKIHEFEQQEGKQQALIVKEQEMIRVYREKEAQQILLKEKLQKNIQEKEELIRRCENLQEVIDRGQKVDLNSLRMQESGLLREREEMEQQIVQLKEQIAQLHNDMAVLRKREEMLNADKNKACTDLQNLQGQIDALEQDTVAVSRDIDRCKADIEQKQADYIIEKNNLAQLGDKQNELIQMILKLREDQSNLNLHVLESRRERQQGEYEKKLREFEEAKKQLEVIRGQHAAELEKVQKQLEQIAAEEEADIKKIQKEEQYIQERILLKGKKIQEEEDKKTKLEEDYQAKCEELTAKMEETQDTIGKVKSAVAELEKRKKTLNDDLILASREQKTLEEWFKSKSALVNTESLAVLKGQLVVMKNAKQNLENAFGGHYFMDSAALEKKMNEYYRSKLQQIEEELNEYANKYAKLMEVFCEGGKM